MPKQPDQSAITSECVGTFGSYRGRHFVSCRRASCDRKKRCTLGDARPLTSTQLDGLRRIRDHGPDGWQRHKGRAGGAVMRMFDRLEADGYVTAPPYRLTVKGRQALIAAGPSRGEKLLAQIAAEQERRYGR